MTQVAESESTPRGRDMKPKSILIGAVILLLGAVLSQAFFMVDEMEHAVVTFFGDPTRVYAGDPAKLPPGPR